MVNTKLYYHVSSVLWCLLKINEFYCKKITDPERAVIGYIATFIGSDCDWDHQYNANRSNIKCKVLSALIKDISLQTAI